MSLKGGALQSEASHMREALGTPAHVVKPSVVDQTDDGPNVIERLDPKDEKEKQNLHKF